MAISTGQVSVTSTPTRLAAPPSAQVAGSDTVTLVNQGATEVEVGGSTLALGSGLRIVAGASQSIDGVAPHELYVVCATSGEVDYIHVKG